LLARAAVHADRGRARLLEHARDLTGVLVVFAPAEADLDADGNRDALDHLGDQLAELGRPLQHGRPRIQEPIQAVVEAVRRALEITPPELASDIVDRGIVMTGGGALIRGLDQLIARETNLPIHVDEEPLTCVVRGAGRILDDINKYRGVLTT
jgi:hypothetical protein